VPSRSISGCGASDHFSGYSSSSSSSCCCCLSSNVCAHVIPSVRSRQNMMNHNTVNPQSQVVAVVRTTWDIAIYIQKPQIIFDDIHELLIVHYCTEKEQRKLHCRHCHCYPRHSWFGPLELYFLQWTFKKNGVHPWYHVHIHKSAMS